MPKYRGHGIVGAILQSIDRLFSEKLDADLVVAHVDDRELI